MKLTEEWFKNEIKRWKTGEWCVLCDAPQWVLPSGEHGCKNIPALHEEITRLKAGLKQVQHYFNILKTHKDISEKDAAFKLAEETVRIVLNG